MIKFVKETPLEQLIYLGNLSDDDVDNLLVTAYLTAATETINTLIEKKEMEAMDLAKAKEIIECKDTMVDNLEYFNKKYPNFNKYLDVESYIYKKNMLLDQLEDFRNSEDMKSKLQPEDQEIFLGILDSLIEALKNHTKEINQNKFNEVWEYYLSYIDLLGL